MSILIRGVEMPTSEEKCKFFQPAPFRAPFCVINGVCNGIDACPLITVPTPHGRLGDLDKLEQMFADIDNAPYSAFDGEEPFYTAEDAAQIIRLAPTIIGKEDGT